MARVSTVPKRIRKFFGDISEIAKMPNLIEMQTSSYAQFLRPASSDNGRDEGLQAIFKSVFPISDFSGKAILEFVSYKFGSPKYDLEECRRRGMTFAAPFKVTFRLIVFEVDPDTGDRSVKDIKEQDVYMGDVPFMTGNGTFIVNGTERVIVSQMHRSPGVFFDHDRGKTHSSGKLRYAARIIPYRGSWLDFEFDAKDIIYVRIDRRRKLPMTTLLYALNMDDDEILHTFYDFIVYERGQTGWLLSFDAKRMCGIKPLIDLVDFDTGEIAIASGQKLTSRLARKLEADGVCKLCVPDEYLIGQYVGLRITDTVTGEVFAEAGEEITDVVLERLSNSTVNRLELLHIDYVNVCPYVRNTLNIDKNSGVEGALFDIYRVMRPGEPPTVDAAQALLKSLFFDEDRYDLSPVGRVKMNLRLDLDAPDTMRVLRKEDILSVLKTLIDIRDGRGDIDDIDNLGNRRVRSVGELMENQYRLGVLRMERAIKERMSSTDVETSMPQDLINAKPVVAAVREFFASSQLSQFMDQTNPLSEITHKRRLSALGPGGLTRERAGFEVRDVHTTHYGRICPVETPEGPNIGLINSLATFARVNKYGFIESPYRKVQDGNVSQEIVYLSAIEETKYYIAQANVKLGTDGEFLDDLIVCRYAGDVQMVSRDKVGFMDVSPKQVVSVAAALIPFLENDDANRALMGSNMQRQAVPLLRAKAPLVGTGIESIVARDSGAAIMARRSGIVDQVDATRIVVRATEDTDTSKSGIDIYNLMKFQRSNQSTCINQRPLVKVDDFVKAGDVIADGPSTHLGELALGRNVLVAFMPWMGYNFEDSILVSERIVRDDVFTSIHIEEFEVMARDIKLGPEEITRDIPNVSEEILRNLDEAGVVYVGADVQAGDILVGKITPRGESPMTPEEKLLRAIFGEKAADVRDTSLRVPPGASGTVIEVRVFNRHGVDKDERALAIEREEIGCLAKDRDDEISILERNICSRLKSLLLGKEAVSTPKGLKSGTVVTEDVLVGLRLSQWWHFSFDDEQVMNEAELINKQFTEAQQSIEARFKDKIEKLQRGDELQPSVLKMVKVFVAIKRKLQPGDKMAGRHGNKGVISRILPIEDMPYLEDGTHVDIVLNPLGVPSRMNVGQILETHLGWACRGMGHKIGEAIDLFRCDGNIAPTKQLLHQIYGESSEMSLLDDDQLVDFADCLRDGVPVATPVFDGAREKDIDEMLEISGLDRSGQTTLYDGRTGEQFDRQVTVGYIYMLKLHHLVDDKIHARSIGPYSLVTQQPLGGKAQFGGQRFGEMEVWALEAYGAAYMLQEMLTVKSDDVAGRTKIYETIVRGDDTFEAGIPESFNVLVKEMRSLCLNVELVTNKPGVMLESEVMQSSKAITPID